MTDTLANAAKPSREALRAVVASMMVYVDFDSGSDHRIKIAADWAAKFDATLIGVAGWLPGREAGGWFAAELERPEDRTDRILGELNKLDERFRTLVGRKVRNVEWRGSYHFPREVVPAEARAADLVIIPAQPVAEDAYHAFDPGTILLNTGRPVLVVPDGAAGAIGKRVLVAWKEAREARRAVQSALPYLDVADHVVVAEVAEDPTDAAARAHLADVETYLLRHGITVHEKSVLGAQGSASQQLIGVAEREGADLIVAGAYGHTRLGEWVFGGVTRDLLQTSKIGCLFGN